MIVFYINELVWGLRKFSKTMYLTRNHPEVALTARFQHPATS